MEKFDLPARRFLLESWTRPRCWSNLSSTHSSPDCRARMTTRWHPSSSTSDFLRRWAAWRSSSHPLGDQHSSLSAARMPLMERHTRRSLTASKVCRGSGLVRNSHRAEVDGTLPVVRISILFDLLVLQLFELIHQNLFNLRHPLAFDLHRRRLERVHLGAPLQPNFKASRITAHRLRQPD